MKTWTRRLFVIGGAAILAPIAAFGAAKTACHMRYGSVANRKAVLASLFPTTEAVKALGTEYLAQTHSNVRVSLRRLEGRKQIAHAADVGCPIALTSALEEACRDDFRCGRVHCIDGWIMAESELDVAALNADG
jgi:hypothetical protein